MSQESSGNPLAAAEQIAMPALMYVYICIRTYIGAWHVQGSRRTCTGSGPLRRRRKPLVRDAIAGPVSGKSPSTSLTPKQLVKGANRRILRPIFISTSIHVIS